MHSPFKHQLPLKKSLNEFLRSQDVEGKRLNIFKSKGLQGTKEGQFSRSSEGLATEDIAYHTLANENTSLPSITSGYAHQCYLNVKVPPQMQGTTSSGMSNPRSYKIRNNFKCLRPSASKQVKRSTRSCNLTIPSMYQKTSQIQQHSPSSTLWR